MLAPYASSGQLRVLLQHKLVAAETERDSVRSVTVRGPTGTDRTISAKYILDATEQGDLLPLTKTEYVTGFESKKQTGELHAPDVPQPANIQSFTSCFAVEYLKGEDHTIEKPSEYAFWRDYVPKMRPAWPGKLLSWEVTHPVTLDKREMTFNPEQSEAVPGPPSKLPVNWTAAMLSRGAPVGCGHRPA